MLSPAATQTARSRKRLSKVFLQTSGADAIRAASFFSETVIHATARRSRPQRPHRVHPAFHYSCDGFRAIWATEQAFRQEAILAVILIPVAILLPVSWTQSALLVLSVFLLLIVETLNSAVEAAIDRIGPELHPLSKKAKDLGSLAVLLTIFADACIWIGVLLDYFLS